MEFFIVPIAAILVLFAFHCMIEFDKDIKRNSSDNYNEFLSKNQKRNFSKSPIRRFLNLFF